MFPIVHDAFVVNWLSTSREQFSVYHVFSGVFFDLNFLMWCVLLYLLVSSVAAYNGNGKGGLDIWTWRGTGNVWASVAGCQEVEGIDISAQGVSWGADFTFENCYYTRGYFLEGYSSGIDDTATFDIWRDEDGMMTLTVYSEDNCMGDVLWSYENFREDECLCQNLIFNGCFSVYVPRLNVSLWEAEKECPEPAAPDTLETILFNQCTDGRDLDLGYFMVYTAIVYTDDGELVVTELVSQCEDPECFSPDCKNVWGVRSTDCKCDNERGGCILADWTSAALPFLPSIFVFIAWVLHSLFM
jgi:hypothetical protein